MVDLFMVSVGKYTSPMDPMGYGEYPIVHRFFPLVSCVYIYILYVF